MTDPRLDSLSLRLREGGRFRQGIATLAAGTPQPRTRKRLMHSVGTPEMWTLFAAFVLFCLWVDFSALRRQGAHRVSIGRGGDLVSPLDRSQLFVRRLVVVVPGGDER
ncbi:MAG: hypothetical protein KatS3mg124_1822 [Porticoccaceae bacterium]|nr:MAG: hypothetical protein KatS3mg124_1822 [Porticoccaceae bacterium]